MSEIEAEEIILPQSVRDALNKYLGRDQPTSAQEANALDKIGTALKFLLDEDMAYRKMSGIEECWMKAEEQYIGIDDANRYEYVNHKWVKPIDPNAPVVTGENRARPDEEVRSTVFPRMTARYVDAAVAKCCEILFPPDDKSFTIKPTPDPKLHDAKSNHSLVLHEESHQPMTRLATADELHQVPMGENGQRQLPTEPQPYPGTPFQPHPSVPPQVPILQSDLAKEKMQQAQDIADRAEKKIWNWMVESKYTRESRKIVFDAARIGVGILKGPFSKRKRAVALTKMDGQRQVLVDEQIFPGCKRISPWNFWPAKGCGEDIHAGDHVWERDFLSARQVNDLQYEEGYHADRVQKVLDEGPGKRYLGTERPDEMRDLDAQYEVFYFTGMLTKKQLGTITPDLAELLGKDEHDRLKDEDSVYAVCTLINDTVVKGTVNPLTESGSFGYHVWPWQERSGFWAGIGVGEQINVPQRIVTAATRRMLDNAGKAGGAQIVIDRKQIVPADGEMVLTGGEKLWLKGADCDDVRKAFAVFEIPIHTDNYLKIIAYAERLGEESSSIPLIAQGQIPSQASGNMPRTASHAIMQDNNANQLLHDKAVSFDHCVTEPFVTEMYEWYLLDDDVPDSDKILMEIDAHGSVTLVNRYLQDQTIAQLASLVTNPAFGIDPKKWFEEFMRTKHLDARKVQYTPEQQEQIAKQPPPKAPQVEAAQIRAQADIQKAQIDVQHDQGAIQADHAVRMKELDIRWQIALLEYSNKRGMALEQAKADLAGLTMKLQTQKELSAQDAIIDLHKHHTERPTQVLTPPTEPAGRAAPGKAWEQ